jgi:hypothetical protein
VKLQASDLNGNAGLFKVTVASTTLDNYIAGDDGHQLMQLVYVNPGDVLNISLMPLTSGKVSAQFMGEKLSFFTTPKSGAYTVVTATTTPGRYYLTTPASPLTLAIDIIAPPPPPPPKPPGFWERVKRFIHRLVG